jgi:cell division septation protein DedD
MAGILVTRTLVGIAALSLVAGCMEGMNPLAKKEDSAIAASPGQTATRSVERDVEAPDVFQASEKGLWDGRPSLGGVWVAHPDVKEPERVIIRNESNGSFVIGALFRRERTNPGPRIEVSSDAAEALGMLAGAPVDITVTALRREEAGAPEADAVITPAEELAAPAEVETQSLDPIAAAEVAIDAPAPDAIPAPAPQTSNLSKPYVQIGIFSIQANANRTAEQMRKLGLKTEVLTATIKDKPYWRVIVGPAMSATERAETLTKVKAAGFTDAYSVTD